MAKANLVAKEILDVIGKENIISYTNCMTRLRVKAKPNFEPQKLKAIDGVIGLIIAGADEFQIVLGTGFVNKVAAAFGKITSVKKTAVVNENLDEDVFQTAAEVAKAGKQKFRGSGKVQTFLSKISKIFTPLIPAFIGAGLLSGVSGLMGAIYCGAMGALVNTVFVVDHHGGYVFLGMHIANIKHNWFSVGFVALDNNGGAAKIGAPHAGLIGAMFSAAITIQVEKLFRRFMPGAIDTILTPILVIFMMLLLNFILIIPLAGYLFTGVSWLFEHIYKNPFGCFILAGIFLIAVVFGVHQGFLPIYFVLIDSTGVNGLFPILAMGGASQVGVCIMLFLLAEKKSVLLRQIAGAIIPGFLGIGEPLIYGVTLPRIRPFIISCIAAAFGGLYLGAISTWGHVNLGMNAPTGPGGLTAMIMMTTQDGNVIKGILIYFTGLLVTYGCGALFCWFGYSKIAIAGSRAMKALYKKDSKYSLGAKIWLSLAFITIIGIFIFWIVSYQKLPKAAKMELKGAKVE